MYSRRLTNILLLASGAVALHFILRDLRKNQPTIHIQESLPLGLNAVTIPPLGIFIREQQSGNDALLQHEMIHWQQYQRMGLLPYYFNYAVDYIRHGYELHPMEQEARVNEDEYCRTNYIDCVRNGRSKTVVNPNFLMV